MKSMDPKIPEKTIENESKELNLKRRPPMMSANMNIPAKAIADIAKVKKIGKIESRMIYGSWATNLMRNVIRILLGRDVYKSNDKWTQRGCY